MASTMTNDEMIAKAAKLQRQRQYRSGYNKGGYITDKEVVQINGINYMRYKAAGEEKMRVVRDNEDIEHYIVTVLS